MSEDRDSPIRKTVSLPASLWHAISEYRHDKRISTETEALRRLVRIGLDGQDKPARGKVE